MNPIPILEFMAGAGLVGSVAAFVWACITRQFTGYDFGTLPLHEREEEEDGDMALNISRPASRLHKTLIFGGIGLVFAVVAWTLYIVIVAASRPPAGG